MPEEKKMNTEDTEIVDIDTSGPEVDVELKDEKEEKKEGQGDIVQPVETPEEKPEVQEEVKQEVHKSSNKQKQGYAGMQGKERELYRGKTRENKLCRLKASTRTLPMMPSME